MERVPRSARSKERPARWATSLRPTSDGGNTSYNCPVIGLQAWITRRMSNPYQPLKETRTGVDKATPDQQIVNDLSADCRGNLQLTSRIAKVASVAAALVSLAILLSVGFTFRLYGLPDGWIWWTYFCYRIIYTPCWLLLAWMMWKYAGCLDRLAENGVREVEATVEQQAKMWLAVGLLVFVVLIGSVVSFVLSAASQQAGGGG